MEYFLVIFFLIRHIRVALDTKEKLPVWDKRLVMASYVSIALAGAYYTASEEVARWLWQVFMVAMLWTIYKRDEFTEIRGLAQTIVLFAAVGFINVFVLTFFPKFHNNYASYFSTAVAFALILCFVIWFYTQKQRSALIKERQERAREEEESRAQKLSLEYLVTERTQELTIQKEELQKTIEELKATQDQLVQSEKMASLGELTAGIAHEIQNPLNFVNNFSELSVELCQELEEELERIELAAEEKDYIRGIIGDLSQNQQKIMHHGKRADSIVKGMLQHSRTSSGEKELTDINALADEYMRLAYHGLRAKNKEFNAALISDFDPAIGKVGVMPQDLGRVFLNLFTNAFYAVAEKKRNLAEQSGTDMIYKPEVKISTKKFDNRLDIRVEDNGTGMPEHVKAKIFQPFFTTKPTGQGTGLGLSMSYDIITKLHGGTLDVETVQGEKTVFKISLPI
ncbi:Adaptive-response sensory-kinase SasA [Dyadobacter sp. CECT 9275]|uniref:histidine kinase n=1 Tax=Dyadobacter helix TaxID=2822344 RepID=A0A916NKW9_9BACT|nr:ATP-binding protein [Dyadobacter sp. CECT 9275]CAG4997909.1 Adaptive-response sensory-kinase SasA [Dyadobacter sp. CECT 9275]